MKYSLNNMQVTIFKVSCCAISPNEQYIVSGSGDKNLQLWELQSGAPTHTLTGHQDKV